MSATSASLASQLSGLPVRDVHAHALEAGDGGLELAGLAGVGDGNHHVAGPGLAGGAVDALGPVELVGGGAGGREERRGVTGNVAGLADARHVQTVAGGLSVEDELLGSGERLEVNARDVLVERGLHDVEKLNDLFLLSCHLSSFCSRARLLGPAVPFASDARSRGARA